MSTFHATKSALRVIQLFPCLSVWFREELVQVINEVYSMIVRWVQNSVYFPSVRKIARHLEGRRDKRIDRLQLRACRMRIVGKQIQVIECKEDCKIFENKIAQLRLRYPSVRKIARHSEGCRNIDGTHIQGTECKEDCKMLENKIAQLRLRYPSVRKIARHLEGRRDTIKPKGLRSRMRIR